MKYTKEDILRRIEEDDVEFVRLQFVDIFGSVKNVSISSRKLETVLNDRCEFDGSSIEGFVRIEESDMFLAPDLDTFRLYPGYNQYGRIAQLICDVVKPDGTPFEGSPRRVLKRAVQRAAAQGYTLEVSHECEFFLFNLDEFGHPTTETYDIAGYFDLGFSDAGDDSRRDIYLALEEMGIDVINSHHEVAHGQHEIDFAMTEVLEAADNIITFQKLAKSTAASHGLYATFMPKPLGGAAGSGMHINMRLKKDGKNAFSDPSSPDGLSAVAKSFIAGIMKHIKGICAVTNPLVNSYKRLTTGHEAPNAIAWSDNRSAMIRVPALRGEDTKFELRSPDCAGNPYLVLALLLEAGMEGLREGLVPAPPVSFNIYDMSEEKLAAAGIEALPSSLEEAVREFKRDPFVAATLGSQVAGKYAQAKEREWTRFAESVTEWEIREYLNKF